ncbi:555_t:CDS:2, partial [Gigaspora rosea]
MTDAIYNTKYELYAIIAIIDGTEFPILYCFIESGKGRDICAAWFKFLHESKLKEVKTILSNKNFAQISSGMAILKNVEAPLRKELLEYINTHFYHHMLIPTADKEFVSTSNEFWHRA